MRKNLMKLMIVSILLTVFLASCKDDEPTYEKRTIENTELLAALQTKATNLTFENGMLVMNDAVANIKSLDLSGANFVNEEVLKELNIFPNLEDVDLSDNKFTVFDFDKLPINIKSINLKGNLITELLNLKPERKFKKLYLPSVAKFDMKEVVSYYMANKSDASLDMKYESDETLVKYDLLRDITDENLRGEMKTLFPSVFTGEQVDLSKEMNEEEQGKNIEMGGLFAPYDKDVTTMDGVQFIICRDEYKGVINMKFKEETPISYFKAPKNALSITLKNIEATGVFDMSTAMNAHTIYLSHTKGIKKVDLSKNVGMGYETSDNGNGGRLYFVKCSDLEEIVTPEAWNEMGKVAISVGALALPKLKALDISKVTTSAMMYTNTFAVLPNTKIIYPTSYKKRQETGDENRQKGKFDVGSEVKESDDFKAFHNKFQEIISVSDFNAMFIPYY